MADTARIGLRARVARRFRARSVDRTRLDRERWETLPEKLRTRQQVAGRAHVACGATHGVLERCDFACTACYLTNVANRTPPLSFDAVAHQLDTLRARLGPRAKVQITAGEVTLLPREELGRIVDHARRIDLDPMVMSNGQRFAEEPGYLEALVRRHGLGKISIHVDTTQRGRRRAPRARTEAALHPVRDGFAELVRATRRATRRSLHAAHTVTVTSDNLDDVGDVVRWSIRNHDAFRLVSFQPVAKVGRTRDPASEAVTIDDIWRRVERAVGKPLNRNALWFGHPECNVFCPMLVVSDGKRREVVEPVPEGDERGARVLDRAIDAIGGIEPLGDAPLASAVRVAACALRHPRAALAVAAYALHRTVRAVARRPGWLAAALLGRVRVRPWIVVVHRFMSREELDTERGRERLAACVFKSVVSGRLVSMCELNATDLRLRENLAAIASAHTERPADAVRCRESAAEGRSGKPDSPYA